ncbi:MAG: hypothetical protein HDT14_10685 [Oscillibacter sp.]|nr:hypothetical protein [Oscillibacter sp.]
MKHPLQNWIDALRQGTDSPGTKSGSGGVFTRSLLCGVAFSTIGLCWKTGYFARYRPEEILSAWIGVLGYILLAMVLFTLGMVVHQTLMERYSNRKASACLWIALGGIVALLIVLL